jgi:hypothetical protein
MSSLICEISSKSLKSAIFKSGTHDCLNQYTSQGHLNSKSISANSNQLFVDSIAFNLSV